MQLAVPRGAAAASSSASRYSLLPGSWPSKPVTGAQVQAWPLEWLQEGPGLQQSRELDVALGEARPGRGRWLRGLLLPAVLLLLAGALAASLGRRPLESHGLPAAALWQQRAGFRAVRGSCPASGLQPLADEATCGAAAKALGLQGRTANIAFRRPEGCLLYVASGGPEAGPNNRSVLCAAPPPAGAGPAAADQTAAAPAPGFPRPSAAASECLLWAQQGCYMIKDKGTCLSSRDGRSTLELFGRKIHGQPCVWCGGSRCAWDGASLCEPYDWVVKDDSFNASLAQAKYSTASCPEAAARATLFCFALMLPFGYEPKLVREQLRQGAGIFACDEYAVFSNETLELSAPGAAEQVLSLPIAGNLEVRLGGKWHTALNTGIFIRVWNAVSLVGRYQLHSWTVKADPDTVFFPQRLRDVLGRQPISRLPLAGSHRMRAACGLCRRPGSPRESCAAHVQRLQRQGRSCQEALAQAAVAPPGGCGCDCGDLACNVSRNGVYLNNCPAGLHGPIEVASREAVATYVANMQRCEALAQQPFGEDMYIRRCWALLGVRRVDEFGLLDEIACGTVPVDCTAPAVAFHPFKDEGGYSQCWRAAERHGRWPGDAPLSA